MDSITLLSFIYLLYYLLISLLFGHSVGILTCLICLVFVFISFMHKSADNVLFDLY